VTASLSLGPLAQAASTHYIDQYLSIPSKNDPMLRGHAVKGGRNAWCPGGSAPAVRARASHDRGAGGLSNGSCASSVCTPFAAIGVGIGSGASASAGARILGASRPWPEGARPLLVLSSSLTAGPVLWGYWLWCDARMDCQHNRPATSLFRTALMAAFSSLGVSGELPGIGV
jgi:hypothetical protein